MEGGMKNGVKEKKKDMEGQKWRKGEISVVCSFHTERERKRLFTIAVVYSMYALHSMQIMWPTTFAKCLLHEIMHLTMQCAWLELPFPVWWMNQK